MNEVLLTTFAARDVIYWAIQMQQGQEEIRNEFLELIPPSVLTCALSSYF